MDKRDDQNAIPAAVAADAGGAGGWRVLLLAGQRPGVDPLAGHFGQELKALVPLAGRPMLARCLDNLLAVPGVRAVTVLAQSPERLRADPEVARAAADARVSILPSGAGIATSVAEAAAQAAEWPVLVATADHPLLSPRTIADFLARAGGTDVAVGVVERAVVRSAFPHNKRTWLHFRGGSWTGANLFALNTPAALNVLNVWAEIEQHRKKGWRLIARFGPLLLLRALTRTITLEQALAKAGRRIGAGVRPVPLADPLAAVDVDKLSDHALATQILKEHP